MDRREALACLADDPDDVYNRRMFGLVPTTIVLVLSIVTYGLRIYCRRKTGQGVKWDDILMGIGTVISFEPAICEYLLLANGLGHHICHVPADQSKRFAVISFALQRANQPALACIKLSILLFYLRIFSSERWLRWAAYANMAYTICWAISTWIVNLTVCTPIAFYYDHTIPGGKCKNQVISGTANGALSLLGDVCILVLPLPVIWKLKINTRRKIALCGVFLLGCLSCVASAIRIAALIDFVPTDATYTQVYASTWTDLELGVAAISGNLPLLAPLFDRLLRRHGTSYYYNRYHGGGHSGPLSSSGLKGSRSGGGVLSGKGGGGGSSTGGGGGGAGGGSSSAQTTVVTTASNKKSHRHEFGRLSDDDDTESQTRLAGGGSDTNIELDDRAILVRTHVDVTTEPAQPPLAAAKGGYVAERSWGPIGR